MTDGTRTITVSGYPPIVAHAIVRADGSQFAAVAGLDPARFQPFRDEAVRCRCGAVEPPDRRLGFGGYCSACVGHFVAECFREHGRLPGPTEFYCLGCRDLVPREQMAARDPDGRRRIRCAGCRREQVRAAKRRYLVRHGIAAMTGPAISHAVMVLVGGAWALVASGSTRAVDGDLRCMTVAGSLVAGRLATAVRPGSGPDPAPNSGRLEATPTRRSA